MKKISTITIDGVEHEIKDAYAREKLENTQTKLTPGVGISIDDNGVIKTTNSGGVYTAGYGITVSEDNVISITLANADEEEF